MTGHLRVMRFMTLSKIEEMMVDAEKIEKGLNTKVTDGGAMARKNGETFIKWAKRINDAISEENYEPISPPTNPEDVNEFLAG